MPAFLLTWSPLRYDWTDLPAMARRVRQGRRVLDRWSCARSKQIRKGDRLFMLRQGAEPRGIFGSGWAVSDWYEDANWRGPGCCNYLDLVALEKVWSTRRHAGSPPGGVPGRGRRSK